MQRNLVRTDEAFSDLISTTNEPLILPHASVEKFKLSRVEDCPKIIGSTRRRQPNARRTPIIQQRELFPIFRRAERLARKAHDFRRIEVVVGHQKSSP